MIRKTTYTLLCLSIGFMNFAQSTKQTALEHLNANGDSYGEIAQQIWGFAEMGYLEEKSSDLLQQTLKNNGFKIESGVP